MGGLGPVCERINAATGFLTSLAGQRTRPGTERLGAARAPWKGGSMNPEDSPAYRWAWHQYECRLQEWRAELLSDAPDWSHMEEIDQQLRSLEAYIVQIELDGWL